jgi:hypothetical protein
MANNRHKVGRSQTKPIVFGLSRAVEDRPYGLRQDPKPRRRSVGATCGGPPGVANKSSM